MAKVIKNMQINIVSEDGEAMARCVVSYEVASSDDASLKKATWVELPLSGQVLADTQAVFDAALALAESTEGIV
jgi:hypothetical protein